MQHAHWVKIYVNNLNRYTSTAALHPCQVAILDEQCNVLPPGQIGEVCIRGPNVTQGYKDNPKANEEAFAGGRGPVCGWQSCSSKAGGGAAGECLGACVAAGRGCTGSISPLIAHLLLHHLQAAGCTPATRATSM